MADTIAAIATAQGTGGIAIVRISGPMAGDILKRAFAPANPGADMSGRRMVYGHVTDDMKRDAADKVGQFNTRLAYSPDWEFWIRLSLLGTVGYINRALSRFRVTSTSTTSSLFASEDAGLKEDERLFVESVASIPELAITDKDLACRKRSMFLRGVAKRAFFTLHRHGLLGRFGSRR